MKKLMTFALPLLLLPFVAIAAEKSFDFPKGKPEITVTDGEVQYSIVDQKPASANSTPFFAEVRFYTTYEGKLTTAWVIINDSDRVYWTEADGLKTGEQKDLERLQKKFKEIALPPLKVVSYRTEETQVSHTFYVNSPVTYEVAGNISSDSVSGCKFILKDEHGDLAEIVEGEFLLPPPKTGKFRLGKKMGKLVALVEKDGAWMIPATDFYPMSVTKTASK